MKRSHSTSNGTKGTSFLNRAWRTIEEMPIYNWIKICETGDLRWIFKEARGTVTKRVEDHWLVLQQQYIDEFRLDAEYKQQIRLTKKLTLLNCEFVETRDRFLLNVIKMTEADLQSTKKKKTVSFYAVLDEVEKYKGFAIDPHKTSVMKWYHTLKNMSKKPAKTDG